MSLRALLFVYDLHGIPHIISLLCNDMCIKYIMRIDVNFVCICVIFGSAMIYCNDDSSDIKFLIIERIQKAIMFL